MLVTLVKTKQDCLKKLLKTVRTTRRISELVRQRVPDRRTGDWKRPTAICVEMTARYAVAGDGLQNADDSLETVLLGVDGSTGCDALSCCQVVICSVIVTLEYLQCRHLPAIEMHSCWQCVCVFCVFRATSALKLQFSVPKELRHHLEILPRTGFIQAQTTFTAQIKFLPRYLAMLSVHISVGGEMIGVWLCDTCWCQSTSRNSMFHLRCHPFGLLVYVDFFKTPLGRNILPFCASRLYKFCFTFHTLISFQLNSSYLIISWPLYE